MGRRTIVATVAALVSVAACGSDGSSDPVADTADPSAPEPTAAVIADGAETTEKTDSAEITGNAENAENAEQRFPDVIDATGTFDGSTWTIAATLSSPYDTPERYADSWRVIGPDGTVFGERFLTHDHANEQPFTRSQSGIEIPDDVVVVTIEGRDQRYGWGGGTFELTLER